MSQITPVNLIVFAILATVAVLAALGVVISKSAVRSALCLVLNFLMLSVLYFTLKAETIGIFQVVVYAGAIMVLFLFVVMLLNNDIGVKVQERIDWKIIIGALAGIALAVLIGSQVYLPLAGMQAPPLAQSAQGVTYGSPEALGMALFTKYGYPFETASLLLMVGIVGSIMLAKRRVR